MTREELIKILEDYEIFVDDDFGGSYKSVIAYAPDKKVSRAHTPIGTLKIIDTFEEIQKENQELKKQLNSDDWINSIKETERHYIYLIEREKQELKKKLDELQTLYNNMFKCHCNRVQVETLLSQQKEFIEWLENEIKNSDICDVYVHGMKFNSAEKMIYKDILSKYKEIIGVKDE